MTVKEIYQYLIKSGMTSEGACALMGNFQAESAMRANNAQDGMTRLSDTEYTRAADEGTIDFAHDSVGYGYAQLTFWSRKKEYLEYAKKVGKSVGDAKTQLDFYVKELKRDYSSLWRALTTSNDLYELTARVCKEYERPAVNNVADRYAFAFKFYESDLKIETESAAESTGVSKSESVEVINVSINLPQLEKGSKGGSVIAAQAILSEYGYSVGKSGCDGKFGNDTLKAVKSFQKRNGLDDDGIIGKKTWSKLMGVI